MLLYTLIFKINFALFIAGIVVMTTSRMLNIGGTRSCIEYAVGKIVSLA